MTLQSQKTAVAPGRVEELYFEGIRKLMLGRSALEVPLLDVPGKMIIGDYAVAHGMPHVVAELEKIMPAEELGQRLKTLGVQAAIGIQGSMWGYVLGRLQRQLDAGFPDHGRLDDDEEAALVYSWWARAIRVYREDDKLVPTQEGAVKGWPILPAGEAEALATRATERGPLTDIPGTRRALAQLEAFIFMLHADARDGTFHHGPYPLENGSILLVKELTNLQSEYMPWGVDNGTEVSRVVVAMVLDGVECEVDLVGGLHITPENYLERCTGVAMFADDDLHPITESEVQELGKVAGPRGRKLFMTFMNWDERQKVMHGTDQYASFLRGWFEAAGLTPDDFRRIVVGPFREASEPYAERLIARDYPPIWEYVASEQEPKLPGVHAA
jgi:hypothetical protein